MALQLDVGVAGGGSIGTGTEVKVAVGGMADGAVTGTDGIETGSCACTVSAAAVMIAPGFCWLGLLEGRLQAKLATMMAMPARTMENLRMGSSYQLNS